MGVCGSSGYNDVTVGVDGTQACGNEWQDYLCMGIYTVPYCVSPVSPDSSGEE